MKKFLTIVIVILFYYLLPAQWFWQNPLPQGNSLQSVSFISKNVGWAVGVLGSIIKTTDGGKNWQLQKCGVPNYLFSVSFADSINGTIVGQFGIILNTRDGGITWQIQSSGTTKNHRKAEIHSIAKFPKSI